MSSNPPDRGSGGTNMERAKCGFLGGHGCRDGALKLTGSTMGGLAHCAHCPAEAPDEQFGDSDVQAWAHPLVGSGGVMVHWGQGGSIGGGWIDEG